MVAKKKAKRIRIGGRERKLVGGRQRREVSYSSKRSAIKKSVKREGHSRKKVEAERRDHMTKVTYMIVEHDGGFAYKVGDVFSESYPSHDAALAAARTAAMEQQQPGETTSISWEDEQGEWHEETAKGDDRPLTEVEDAT
jgi:hypothetical protein